MNTKDTRIRSISRSCILSLVAALSWISCAGPDSRSFRNTVKIAEGDSEEAILAKAVQVVPSPRQMEALRNEFIAFVHFGPNTFTCMEWGTGHEDPSVFALEDLDTDQWCAALKKGGISMVILTVKHHDGFVLWQSRYTDHGIMSCGFRNGRGDVLGDLSRSCRKYGMKLGIYLSPADLWQIESPDGLYGNLSEATRRTIPREVEGRPFKDKRTFSFVVDDYNEYFLNQLFEVLTEYGPVHEVWLDGAHPKRKGGQQYNYAAWRELIRTVAPEAVVFGREDVRWCGNEAGKTRETEWNVIPYLENPDSMSHYPDITAADPGSRENLYKARYLHYQQAETNTSIREGWFYRNDDEQKVRNADDVFDIYERAVGGNSTFLLNIPANREGRLPDEDVSVLKETGERIRKTYGSDLLQGAEGPRKVMDSSDRTCIRAKKGVVEISLPEKITANRIVLQEPVWKYGERVESHVAEAFVEGDWKVIATGTNIGYKRILRFPEVTSDRFRIRITGTRAVPYIATFTIHHYEYHPPVLKIARDEEGWVSIVPEEHEFKWKRHGENSVENLNGEMEIRYTTDGSRPERQSAVYEGRFRFPKGEIQASAFSGGREGSVSSAFFGYLKEGWTSWGDEGGRVVDMKGLKEVEGFIYHPDTEKDEGYMDQGRIEFSLDGRDWFCGEDFYFGNLVNDPSPRKKFLKDSVKARFVRFSGRKTASLEEMEIF